MATNNERAMASAGLELVAEVRRLREALVDMSKQRDDWLQSVTNLIHAIEADLDSETAKRVLNDGGYITQ